MSKNSDFSATLSKLTYIVGGTVAGVFVIGLLFDYRPLGPWGDFFGGLLNPVLTFCTFIAILHTIRIQKEELNLTRDELELTRVELSRSADAMELQIKTINKQNFESTFFQMLNLHNAIVNAMDESQGDEAIKGRHCFKYTFLNSLQRSYGDAKRESRQENRNTTELELIDTAYQKFWHNRRGDLAHYFRYLFNLIRFVENNAEYVNGYYIDLVRAQLSDPELVILFYNCISPQGKAFSIYAERYELFDNLDPQSLIEPNHAQYVNPKAFGIKITNWRKGKH